MAELQIKVCDGKLFSYFSTEMYVTCAQKIRLKGQIMYFLVNVSPPKQLDLATLNFVAAAALVT